MVNPSIFLSLVCLLHASSGFDLGLDNLGEEIKREVKEGLKPLDDLGEKIEKNVQESLRPVREMEFRFRLKDGTEGTTIATFNDKKFIVKDSVYYECNGKINDNNGLCDGTLTKLAYKNKEDFCFAAIKSRINNWFCVGTGDSISSGIINGKIYCNSPDNNPVLTISAEDYRNLCRNYQSATYKYFTTEPLGEYGPEVRCSTTEQSSEELHICSYTENNRFASTNTNTNIVINTSGY